MSLLRYRSVGDGPALILLHGFCEAGYIWENIIPFLSNDFTIYCPDLPGHGLTPLSDSINSIRDLGALVNRWVQDESITEATIIGHSMGGYVLLEAIDQQPGLYSKAGLFHSTPLPDSPEKKQNRDKSIKFIQEHGAAPFFDVFIPSLYYREGSWKTRLEQEIRKTSKATLLAYTAWMRDRADNQHVVKEFGRDFLILAGSNDEFIPLGSLKDLQTKIDFQLSVLTGIGHLGMMEDPEASAKIIRDFIVS
ncbi:alpha/beta fold hydrolase [Fulvivirga sedimenti]|uniref:Alpha/beta hydrolase n=1 Tax=Fulvivirga sedimenti TaxID=2879465 RepID=A0A9X1HX54_9BACT|nr:alpha/beta hydrolase [Fulvivirga sedimenti]MCA6078668.1 alpha/beta hydrolase [Fulvivirga sedimenti]